MIRIVIAEDQGMLLGAMKSLLSMEDDMEVVGLAKTKIRSRANSIAD